MSWEEIDAATLRDWLCSEVLPQSLGAEIEDVANQALLALFDAIDKGKKIDNKRAYLRGIARYMVFDHWAAARRSSRAEELREPSAPRFDGALQMRFWFAVRSFYQTDSRCARWGCARICDHDFLGVPYDELASRLGMTVDSVKKRNSRCKQRLIDIGHRNPELLAIWSLVGGRST